MRRSALLTIKKSLSNQDETLSVKREVLLSIVPSFVPVHSNFTQYCISVVPLISCLQPLQRVCVCVCLSPLFLDDRSFLVLTHTHIWMTALRAASLHQKSTQAIKLRSTLSSFSQNTSFRTDCAKFFARQGANCINLEKLIAIKTLIGKKYQKSEPTVK